MHSAAVRPYFNAGVALVGASVIAAAPLAPAPPHISLPTIRSAEVALTAAAGPLDAYAQLLHNTFLNVGTLTHQTFQNGVAPLLQQVVVNQLTLVSGLGSALQQSIAGVPAVLAKALGEIASGQVQAATETLGTGVVQALLPLLTPLMVPINNIVAVANQLPTIVLLGGLAVLQPPLAALESTGQAIQGIIDSVSKGDLVGAVGAVVSVPAVILNGVLNGYTPTQTGGLLTPGLGTLSILVNIRDLIVNALKPTVAATSAVTATKTAAAKVVTLDVAPAQGTTTTKSTDTSTSATDTTAAEGKSTDAKDGAATTTTKNETSGKTTESTTPAAGETGSSSGTTSTGTDATSDPAKGDTSTKGDSSSAPSTSDNSSTSTSKSDSDSTASDQKASDTKKDADTKKDSDTAKSSHEKTSKKTSKK